MIQFFDLEPNTLYYFTFRIVLYEGTYICIPMYLEICKTFCINTFKFLDGLLIGKGEKSKKDAAMTLPTSPPDDLKCAVQSEYNLTFSWSEPKNIAAGVTVDVYRFSLEMTGSSIRDTITLDDGFGKNVINRIILITMIPTYHYQLHRSLNF